jgi:hypothetical protein
VTCAPLQGERGSSDQPPGPPPEFLEELSRAVERARVTWILERRCCDGAGGRLSQETRFYALEIFSGDRIYVVADARPSELLAVARLRSLPVVPPPSLRDPVPTGPTVVGHLFHEYAHALELDHVHRPAAHLGKGVLPGCLTPSGSGLTLLEDPSRPTLGYNAFSDDGMPADCTTLVERGALAGYLDSATLPFRGQMNGFVGWRGGGPSLPRTTNLVVKAPVAAVEVTDGWVLTGLEVRVLGLGPRRTRIYLGEADAVLFEGGVPVARSTFPVDRPTTIQSLVARMSFVTLDGIRLPTPGGFCVKGNSAVRSAQTAPAAYLTDFPRAGV